MGTVNPRFPLTRRVKALGFRVSRISSEGGIKKLTLGQFSGFLALKRQLFQKEVLSGTPVAHLDRGWLCWHVALQLPGMETVTKAIC